jgi:hypothetical protein
MQRPPVSHIHQVVPQVHTGPQEVLASGLRALQLLPWVQARVRVQDGGMMQLTGGQQPRLHLQPHVACWGWHWVQHD